MTRGKPLQKNMLGCLMTRNSADFFSGRVTHLTAREIMGNVFYGDGFTQPKSGMDALEMKYANAAKPRTSTVTVRNAEARRTGGPGVPITRTNEDWELGHEGGLADEIRKNGYDMNKPVHIVLHDDDGKPNPQVIEGHHRIAVMYKHFPDQPIPVRFWKNYDHFAAAAERGNVPGA